MSGETISGRVLRISHTFKGLYNTDHLFIELWCWDTLQHIRVDKPGRMDWLSSLQVNAWYRFTPLLKGKVKTLNGNDIPVYAADPHSGTTVTKLSVGEEHEEKKQKYMKVGEIHDPTLISYQGRVLAVVDGEAGVYRLEEGRVLYITHLKDTTAELWSWEKPHPIHAIPLHRCLEEGDEVKIDGCHEVTSSNGDVLLVCCGRSLVVNLSQPFIPQPCLPFALLPWEVQAVHTYGLSQGGIAWLLEQKAVAAAVTYPLPLEEHFMETLLREAVTHKLLVPGEDTCRHGEQFVRHSSNCPVVRDFLPPYKVVTVEEVAAVLRQPSEMVLCHEEACPFRADTNLSTGIQPAAAWHCWSFSLGPKTPYILLGKLVVDKRKGILKIESYKSVDAILMNTMQGFIHKVGTIVGVYNFHMVKEEFLVQQHEAVTKNYIICNSSSVIILESNADRKVLASSYECEVLYKGPLVSFHRKSDSEFWPLWFFNLRVNFTSHPERKKKPSVNMVRVMEGNLHLFPILTSGDMLQIHPGKEGVATALSRNKHCAWTRELCIEFDDTVYLCKASSQRPCRLNFLNIRTALNVEQDKYCIQGIVVSKHFQKPRYESELNVVPVEAFKNQNIGTPMGKKTVLVLKDTNSDDSTVVYLPSSYYNLVTSYPLGILPQVEVQISLLVKRLPESGIPYFVATNMTEVKPVFLHDVTIPPELL